MRRRHLSHGITWEQWHDAYANDPDFRAALADYHALRRQARINRQLAAAVPSGGSNPVYRRFGEHWIKGETASATWSKRLKRRFRDDFSKRIKVARKNLGDYILPAWKARPGKACDGRIARQYRTRATRTMPVADEQAATYYARYEGIPLELQTFGNDTQTENARRIVSALWSHRSDPFVRSILAGCIERLTEPLKTARRLARLDREAEQRQPIAA